MADEANNPRPFNLRMIRDLVGLMSKHDLSEIDLCEGELRIQLRRGGREGPAAPTTASAPAPQPAPPVSLLVSEPEKPSRPVHLIKSPTPGTFYMSPSPDADPFVQVGSRVTPNSVVCVIEAMKIFTEIQAECTGVITEIMVENQHPVEYGQVLFKVDPAA